MAIKDGYSRSDTFPATKRHGALTVTYRPMLRAERNRLAMQVSRMIDAKKEEEATGVTAAALALKIAEWDSPDWTRVFIDDVQKTDGVPVISKETIEKMEPNLFDKLYRAVAGYDDEEQEVDAVKRELADVKN